MKRIKSLFRKKTDEQTHRDDKPVALSYMFEDKWELDRSSLDFERLIQRSSDKRFHWWSCRLNGSTFVSVKCFNKDYMKPDAFVKEVSILKKLNHPKLAQLIGVCSREEPFYIVTENTRKGTLLDFLLGEGRNVLDTTIIIDLSTQINEGMTYLESCGIVHRDLAARNVLVCHPLVTKVAGFDMSRELVQGVYQSSGGEDIPVRWTAPEGIFQGRFSVKSDVWSFGILLTEITSFGRKPYPGLKNKEVAKKVNEDYRMPKPPNTPSKLYEIMLECWRENPEDRPSFANIHEKLLDLKEEQLKQGLPFESNICRNEADIVKSRNQDIAEPLKREKVEKVSFSYIIEGKWQLDRSSLNFRRLVRRSSDERFDWWLCRLNCSIPVSVKCFNEGIMKPDAFLKEVNILKRLNHPKLAQLIGVCLREEPIYIVTQTTTKGTLIDFLREEGRTALAMTILIDLSTQINEGMTYLESCGIVHRDLAARNVLVDNQLVTKIAGFDMSQELVHGIHQGRTGEKLPIKWTAPEGCLQQRFSVKSDVWSFGILLTEIMTFGREPYPGMTTLEVLENVCDEDYRMPKPPNTPSKLYEIMLECWRKIPKDRPPFTNILEKLLELKEEQAKQGLPFEQNICETEADVDKSRSQNTVEPRKRQEIEAVSLSYTIESKWQLDRSSLSFQRLILRSSDECFDWWLCHLNGSTPVSVKCFNEGYMKPDAFLNEVNLLKRLNHPKLAQLIGVCWREEPICIVTELTTNGTLLDFLRGEGSNALNMTIMINISTQITDGMAYLESCDIVHRDLAARNVLVNNQLVIKIAGFDMSQELVQGVYEGSENEKLPINWTAPEVLLHLRFSVKSDVWSFGILLTEMTTFGRTPYPGMTVYEVHDKVCDGFRMPKPPNTPSSIYDIMLDCWRSDPESRPSFINIREKLLDLKDKQLKQGDETIYNAAYYRALEAGQATNTRIPIMIVGQDRGGKTSLKKHLLGLPFDGQEPSTSGIEVHIVELTDENAEEPWKRKEMTQFILSEDEVKEQILKQAAQMVSQQQTNSEKHYQSIASIPNQPTIQYENSGHYEMDQTLFKHPNNFNTENSGTPFRADKTTHEVIAALETLPEALIDDIKSLEKDVTHEESVPLRAFVHDLAGQSLFHDTHHLFLKLQCPYVVVHDLTRPLRDPAQPRFKPKSINVERNLNNPLLATNLDNFLSWLTVLARLRDSAGGGPLYELLNVKFPPVLIALTKGDRFEGDVNEVMRIIQDILTEKGFENVFIEFYVIDNTSSGADDVRKLRGMLYRLCKAILEKQPPVPIRWLQFEASLSKKMLMEETAYILVEEAQEMAKICKVEDFEAAMRFLHHQGSIVHHPGSSVVVLNPQWLMNLLTDVITIPQDDNPSDAVYRKLMTQGIMKREYLERKIHGELLQELMLQFGLICPWTYKGSPAFIVPSISPLMERGEDVEAKMSASPIAPIFFIFDLGYVLPGLFTRFLVEMINMCREFLRNQQPRLYCNYTLLALEHGEGKFDVYFIQQLARFKIGVVPRPSVSQRCRTTFASYLKQVMTSCMTSVKDDEELIYRNVDFSLAVKCSACFGEHEKCLRHGELNCQRDDCGHFWPLEELQGCTEDPVCDYGSVVETQEFSLERAKPWINSAEVGVSSCGSGVVESSLEQALAADILENNEIAEIAQRIPHQWMQVALLTKQFEEHEIENIRCSRSYEDESSKSLNMLMQYKERKGTRKQLSDALRIVKNDSLARQVMFRYFVR